MARFFEVSTYYLVALGIDGIGALIQDKALPYGLSILEIVIGIVCAVMLRFIFVSRARRAFRRVGQYVSFDLREQLFSSVLRQGPEFFARIGVGDLMTRAVQDCIDSTAHCLRTHPSGDYGVCTLVRNDRDAV